MQIRTGNEARPSREAVVLRAERPYGSHAGRTLVSSPHLWAISFRAAVSSRLCQSIFRSRRSNPGRPLVLASTASCTQCNITLLTRTRRDDHG